MKKRIGRGVVGRAVTWQGSTWTVSKVYGHNNDFVELRHGHNNRDWIVGMVLRADVKFVKHCYEVKA